MRNDVDSLLRASRSRPATIRDVARMVTAGGAAVAPTKRMVDGLQKARATPLTESGHDALLRADRQRRGDRVESGNDIETQLGVVNAAWNRLQREVSRAARATPPVVSQAFLTSFLTDYHIWSSYNADHVNDSMVNAHSVLAQIEQHRQTMERWRTAFQALGGVTAGSPTQAVPPGLIEETVQDLGGVRQIAAGAGSAMTMVMVLGVAAVVAVVAVESGGIAKRLTPQR